jgi:glycosyltransferase involved in cell wall biosynthesis
MSLSDFAGKISVIMPAYNEERVIRRSIEETAKVLDGCAHEIIVVDDGSSDCTCLEAQRAASLNPCVEVIHCSRNGGKGRALCRGFDHCSGELVAFLDADLDLHPRQLRTLYQVMLGTGADVVIGSKRHPHSRLDYPWHRQIVSVVYFGMVKALFGLSIRDTQTGIKLFRYAALADALPRVQTMGYAYDLELLVAATRFGYRIAEAPIELSYQHRPRGHIRIRAILATWWDTMRIFYCASFWKWLQPRTTTKLWMVALAAGLVIASVGAASSLTFLPMPDWLSRVGYYALLKFVPRPFRNLSLIVIGIIVAVVSLIQLNKSLMRAFARSDDGGLAGIRRKD